ncbi:hypothetical protein D3877_23490 [Azospirillum cavernae]|uniref:Uncharacterized protein n=1 Tax=Azospirillum cavernae TaxID=2320860 RepID=A0A418VP96_9PROT|nr:hypothetical protein [Azospirillum cavernae]RJF78097.1 hypothetical protein D3877_23490 [Azospirillum cavernae]
MASTQRLKQIAIPAYNLALGDAEGRGASLAPGGDGYVLTMEGGAPVWMPSQGGIVFERRSFTEAGPAIATTGIHTLNTTLPDGLQGGNKDGLIVTINGMGIDLTAVSLDGAGPYVVKIDMGVVGYSLDSSDTVAVYYMTST